MEEKKNNAKCPHCGAELYVGLSGGSGICTSCGKQFDAEKAIKLYESIHKPQVEEKKKADFGEEYLEVERILQRAEFYFKRKEWSEAKRELEDALKITTSDYRVYMGLVRVETEDFTAYHNESHKEYLNKAIEVADNDEKSVIMRLYKDFYQLSKFSDEDIAIYKKEENVAIKRNLEEKFKQEIPFYIKKEKGLKTQLSLFFTIFIGAGIAIFLGFYFNLMLVLALGSGLLFASYFFIRNYFVGKKEVALFNALLDFYDGFDGFMFEEESKRIVLDCMKNCRESFAEKLNYHNQEENVSLLMKAVLESENQSAIKFVKEHKVLSVLANDYVPDDEEEDKESN